MAMKHKFLDSNTKHEVIHLYEVGGSSKINIGKQYELTTIVHYFEEQWKNMIS
jgi:hypothetical protein